MKGKANRFESDVKWYVRNIGGICEIMDDKEIDLGFALTA